MRKARWVVVFDCDGTLTPKSKTLYDIVEPMLDPDHLEESEKLKKYYLSIIKTRPLSKREERDWLSKIVDLYIQSKFTNSTIRHSIGAANIKEDILRPKVRSVLEFLKEQKIPVAIISYGFWDFIQWTLETSDLSHLVTKIYAAKFLYGDCFRVTGIKPGTEVFPSTKRKFSRDFAKKYWVPRNRILAIGDARSDAPLSPLKGNYFEVSENFDPVLEWLSKKIGVPLPQLKIGN